MDSSKERVIVTSKLGTAHGVFIDIQGAKDIITAVLNAPADHTVEVAVRFGDIVNEFTLSNFLTRLGFTFDTGENDATKTNSMS